MRRLHESLLLALLLVAVQTAILAHDHGDTVAPVGAAMQSCEFCAGHHAAAPAPEAGKPAHPLLRSSRLPDFGVVPALPARAWAAHRSRAPPAFRSA